MGSNANDERRMAAHTTRNTPANELDYPTLLQLPNGKGAKLKPVSTAWEILAENGEIIPIPYEGLTALAPNGKAFLWQEGHEIEPLLPGKAADWEIINVSYG